MLSISIYCEIADFTDKETDYIKEIDDDLQNFISWIEAYLYMLSSRFINRDTVELNIVGRYELDYLGW